MDQISDFLPTQVNEFECQNCGTHIELESVPHVPVFPCQVCGYVNWKIYAINDTVIYPDKNWS